MKPTGIHIQWVSCEEKLFLTFFYLEFLDSFFVDCDTLAYSCMIFFKLWIFLKNLIYRSGYVELSNPQWNIKVFLQYSLYAAGVK